MKIFMFVYEDTLCVTRGNWMAELKAGANSGGDEKRAFSFSRSNSAGPRGGGGSLWKFESDIVPRLIDSRYRFVPLFLIWKKLGKSVFERMNERILRRWRQKKAKAKALIRHFPLSCADFTCDWINNWINNWIVVNVWKIKKRIIRKIKITLASWRFEINLDDSKMITDPISTYLDKEERTKIVVSIFFAFQW